MSTRTGGFAIGFRQGWSSWQKDVPALAAWAAKAGFDALDLGGASPEQVAVVQKQGLRIGTVDILGFGQLMNPDAALRSPQIEKNVAHIKAMSAAGAKVFFTCLLPANPAAPRKDNYKLAVDAFAPLAQAAADAGATIAVEGYPGGGPHYGAIGCTPETVRALLKDIPKGLSLNFDPSHLIRLGVDPVRFVAEFAPHFSHAHGKDTELFPDAVYEYGLYQGAAFAEGKPFGEHVWRYTIPGHGITPWTRCLKILKDAGFKGAVSVELEDGNFNGSEAGEKEGLLHSLAFLRGA